MKNDPSHISVENYIEQCPKEVWDNLNEIRAAILDSASGAIERTDYFDMPGYSYEGYDYDGMFAWFSFKKPFVRLHVRPPVIENNKKELAGYKKTKSIVCFPSEKKIPKTLVKKLVKESIQVMKDKRKDSK